MVLVLFCAAEAFIDVSLCFGYRTEKRRRTFFPETWVWHCLNVRYLNLNKNNSLGCVCVGVFSACLCICLLYVMFS